MTPDTPTEKRTDDTEASSDSAASSNSMGGVDHTHPDRNTTFGSIFGRGPSIAADGGEPATGGRSSSDRGSGSGTPATASNPDEDTVMEDVDHEAPSDTGANATFERGAEHTGESDPADVADPVDEATDE